MDCCKAPLKCILFLLNVLFWIVGGFLLYAGISYLQAGYGSVEQVNAWPGVILLCSASILILGGIIGCIGAISEKKSCLGLFLVFLGTVLVVQAAISGVMLVRKSDADGFFKDFVWRQFKEYGNATSSSTNNTDSDFNTSYFIDTVQEHLECCGYNSYKDWHNETWSYNETTIPLSCCKPRNTTTSANCTGSIDQDKLYLIYTQGCMKPLDKAFRVIYDFLSWVALGFAIFIFVGAVVVIGLVCYQRNRGLGYSPLSPQYTQV